MLSTWTFHTYTPSLPRRSLQQALRHALAAAQSYTITDRMESYKAYRWYGKGPPGEGEETVEFMVRPWEEGMTWTMLVEGIHGLAMLMGDGVGFRFEVLVRGREVGRGVVGKVRGEVGREEVERKKGEGVQRRGDVKDRGRGLLTLTEHGDLSSLPTGVTNLTLPDPFIWHHALMTTTWEFHDFESYLPRSAAGAAWRRVFDEAVNKHDLNDKIEGRLKRWTGASPDGTVDIVMAPGREMTWKMLVEGIRGAEMVVYTGVEFEFLVTAEGFRGVAAYGETRRRKTSSTVGREKVKGKREVYEIKTIRSAKPDYACRTMRDPFIWHQPGMRSTWEFSEFHGRLSFALALLLWNDALNEAYEHGDGPMTRQRTWSRTVGGETAALEVIPLQGMKWSMLVEASRGAALVDRAMMEYQFIVLAEGGEGEVGYGRLVMREKRPSLESGRHKLEGNWGS
ncbi:MAG: hypothetical protein Q9219_001052 [cf. Caloplaca sp. 3 TL-2023]